MVVSFTAVAVIAGSPLQVFAVSPVASEGESALAAPSSEVLDKDSVVDSTMHVSQATDSDSAVDEQIKTPIQRYTLDQETGHWSAEKGQGEAEVRNSQEDIPSSNTQLKNSEGHTGGHESSSKAEKSVDSKTDIKNQVKSDATSGDASVTKNTEAGSAKSGDASVDATVINMVNSTLGLDENHKIAEFTKDINGDVNGDIILNPLLLKAMLESSKSGQNSSNDKNKVDVNTEQSLSNDINLNAKSGNATVSDNTKAGDATSGSATAVANIVNVLNSMIASSQSFIGTINIYGNLNGDILIAPDFIPKLIASNGGNPSDIQVSSEDTKSIVNNISAVASSGDASVFDNTEAGNAISGDARTNVVIFNLTGHQLVAKNSLLVFVNVLGKWVGVIVDAPEGATAAMISNDVSSSGHTPDLVVNSVSRQGITNSIAVTASSGDAIVARNTSAGDAISGDATALVNVANVSNSQISNSGWFGVLFINVFKNWFGSFGVDTAFGNAPEVPAINLSPKPKSEPVPIKFRPRSAGVRLQSTPKTYSYVPYVMIDYTDRGVDSLVSSPQSVIAEYSSQPTVLASSDKSNDAQRRADDSPSFLAVIASILIIGMSAVGARWLLG